MAKEQLSATAVQRIRQQLAVISGTAEIELATQPAVRDKILGAVRAIDRLLNLIEELANS